MSCDEVDCDGSPFCGDGNVDPGEECDDGNNEDGDGCSADCMIEPFCGDGNVDPGEECDDGNNEDGDGCSADCMIECVLEVTKTCFVPVPPQAPTGDDCQGKVVEAVFEYTGDSCSATTNDQEGKVECSGDPGAAPVSIVVTRDADKVTATPDSGIFEGDTVSFTHSDGELRSDTEFDVGGQSLKIHTSCSKPLNVGDQFGSMRLVELTTTEGGTATLPEPEDPEPTSECTFFAAPPPPHCTEKVEVLSLRYLGGGCDATTNDQEGQVECSGAASVAPVRIVVSSDDDIFLDTGEPANVSFGDIVDAVAANGGRSELRSDTDIEIFDEFGNSLQTLNIHTSCSKSLNLGDRFGAVEVFGLDIKDVGVFALGAEVEYTYTITNNNSIAVTNVTAMDDQLVPMDVPGSPIDFISANGGTETLTASVVVMGDTVNTVTVSSDQCPDATATATVTAVAPPLVCSTKVASMLLQYTGPTVTGPVVVEFEADKFSNEPVIYNIAGDLVAGMVLASLAENDTTIDATAHDEEELGSKTRIFINGVEEVIHTSCSTPFTSQAPAPLDNPKGDPSPNWFVLEFTQKP